MEVRLFPNSARPGVGMRPRRESQRPLLPQHARHCPVLEAGSALGFLVYPPLEPNESFHIEYQGEGRYQFVYCLSNPLGKWDADLLGHLRAFRSAASACSRKRSRSWSGTRRSLRDDALGMARAFIVPEDLGTPPGAISLRGATNFQTPPGWDTVYTPIFNMIERPVAPMLVVRVETDWYPHETEFRYVLQPGEGIPGAHNLPIGQVLFVPREEITMRDCREDELAAIRRAKEEFSREKAASKVLTPTGLQYSPHYSRQSRVQKS